MPLIEYHSHPAAPPPEPDPHTGRRMWLDGVIESGRADHTRADAKASLLLVIPSAGVALGAGQLGNLALFPAVLGWLGLVLAVSALALLGAVVWPRTSVIPSLDGAQLLALAEQLCGDPETDLLHRAAEAARLGAITRRKYRILRSAMLFLGGSFAFAVAAASLA